MIMKEKIEKIRSFIENKREEYIAASDEIWSTPELFFHEDKSAEVLINLLKKEGFDVQKNLAGLPTAFIGSWGSGKPVIGFLGEFDALPGLSQEAGIPKKMPITPDGAGHGCAHNLLGVGALAAAVACRSYMQEHGLKGTVRYYGCPGEEAGWGKMFLCRDGYFNDCDMCFSWHPEATPGVRSVSSLAVICGMFYFKGKASHASATPYLGRSALDAAELMSVGVNYLREHIIPEARVHYAYQDVGGSAPNVVQSHSCVKYFIRAPKIAQCKEIAERVKNVALGASMMTGTEADVQFISGICDFQPNFVASNIASEALMAIGGPEFDEDDYALAEKFWNTLSQQEKAGGLRRIGDYHKDASQFADACLIADAEPYFLTGKVGVGSTDLGDVSNCCPTAYFADTCYAAGTADHSWQLCAQASSSIGHKGMLHAAKCMALAGVIAIENPDRIAEAKQEYDKKIGSYICPVGDEVKPQL